MEARGSQKKGNQNMHPKGYIYRIISIFRSDFNRKIVENDPASGNISGYAKKRAGFFPVGIRAFFCYYLVGNTISDR